MSKQEKVVAGIKLSAAHPTTLSFRELYTWVIWQYPRPQEGGFSGAVRPPGEGGRWFPAIINSDEQVVQVYGHLSQTYATPETAVAYFSQEHKGQQK